MKDVFSQQRFPGLEPVISGLVMECSTIMLPLLASKFRNEAMLQEKDFFLNNFILDSNPLSRGLVVDCSTIMLVLFASKFRIETML